MLRKLQCAKTRDGSRADAYRARSNQENKVNQKQKREKKCQPKATQCRKLAAQAVVGLGEQQVGLGLRSPAPQVRTSRAAHQMTFPLRVTTGRVLSGETGDSIHAGVGEGAEQRRGVRNLVRLDATRSPAAWPKPEDWSRPQQGG